MNKYPIGFMSYSRFNDEHDHGRLTGFRKRLSGEVEVHTGERFDIFQDRNDIEWGHHWPSRIDNCLDHGTFLFPIITPSFFKSEACREELERFLARESRLGRDDLIFPLYYVTCPILSDASKCQDDPLAKLISERHYFDWRELRNKPLSSPQSARMMAKLAVQIAAALESRIPGQCLKNPVVASPPRDGQGTAGLRAVKEGGVPPANVLYPETQARLWPDMAPPSTSTSARMKSPPIKRRGRPGSKSSFEI